MRAHSPQERWWVMVRRERHSRIIASWQKSIGLVSPSCYQSVSPRRDSPWVGLASLDGVSKTLIGPLKARVQRPQSREYHKHVSCSKDPHYKALLKIIMSFVLSVNINWDKSLVAIQNVQMPRPPRPKYPEHGAGTRYLRSTPAADRARARS
ncbi:hypothetical protein MGG_18031 [Pyricularia oryzae 70-15]|uniref:Uncharacterized protein n=2 Tax=Pyricularia oryzae TaxID=318829 RepID=G4NJX5_PYRO7|nr:uncharacterized protein MGG_18031 [Pyricularia oryzae 70-15]EHA46504.1 hypothetical protein MGG_18031 [Pyricularia oryzae 70-15]